MLTWCSCNALNQSYPVRISSVLPTIPTEDFAILPCLHSNRVIEYWSWWQTFSKYSPTHYLWSPLHLIQRYMTALDTIARLPNWRIFTLEQNRGKVKFISDANLSNTPGRCMRSGGTAPCGINLGARWRRGCSFTLRPLYSRNKSRG